MKNTEKRSDAIKRMSVIGMFCALAYVCVCVFRIKVSFLTLDIKDAVITASAMMLGPIAGVIISLIVAFIEMITISDTVYYGFLMNFLSSATFSLVASFVYRRKKTLFCAITGLMLGVISVTAVMMLANLFITPYYMGVPRGEVVKLIPKLLLPFNLLKALLNSALVMIIYKPISTALKRAKLIKRSDADERKHVFDRKSLIITLAATALLALCLVIFFVVLKAKIDLF
jgi:riboflavin transporter FmnP